MKRIITSIISALAITGFISCGGNTETTEQTDSIQSEADLMNTIQSMEEYGNNGTIEVNGSKYSYYFTFSNDQNLPVITNHEGYRYYDNQVELAIYRGTGKSEDMVYSHVFTKESFKSLIPEGDYSKSALVGFNYNYMNIDKHDRFYFIAAVGDPDESSDLLHTVGISISTSGEVSTQIVTDIDTEPISDDLNIDPSEDAA